MKKYFATLLCGAFFVIPCLGSNFQNQEHQHKDASRKQYEDREKRYEVRMYWQMPLRVMDELGIGYFTLRLSKRVGETGKVYASDIDKDALAFLDERRKESGLDKIVIILGREDNPLIPEASVNLILMVNTIHLVKEKTLFLANIRKSLKEDGRVVFVQWNAEKMDPEAPGWDPKDRELHTMNTMLNTIYGADYEVLDIMDFLPMQLIYICKPSDSTIPTR